MKMQEVITAMRANVPALAKCKEEATAYLEEHVFEKFMTILYKEYGVI